MGFTVGAFQVLGFAAFFALVLKTVEDEEEPVAPLPGRVSGPGNGARVQAGLWNLTRLRKPRGAQTLGGPGLRPSLPISLHPDY